MVKVERFIYAALICNTNKMSKEKRAMLTGLANDVNRAYTRLELIRDRFLPAYKNCPGIVPDNEKTGLDLSLIEGVSEQMNQCERMSNKPRLLMGREDKLRDYNLALAGFVLYADKTTFINSDKQVKMPQKEKENFREKLNGISQKAGSVFF